MKPGNRYLSDGTLNPLDILLSDLGFKPYFDGILSLSGSDPILKSPHYLGEAVSYVLALDAVGAASIWKYRTGKKNNISLSIYDAIHYLHPTHFIWQSGYKIDLGAESVPTNGLFRCADGRMIMIESGPPYRKLETGYLNFFNCGNNRNALGKVIAEWDALKLENALADLGLPGCIAYTRNEWLDHEQGKILARTPVVEIEKIASGHPVDFSHESMSPLSGIKVLDFTHVLAGPRSTRTLAEFGAHVLHISSPYHRDTLAQNFAVDHGKRSAYLDLTNSKDLEKMRELLSQADVFANSYRPSVVERFGLTAAEAAKMTKNGIIYLSVNAYGHEGPWQKRPGFDQNGQVASGFAVREGTLKNPKFSPVFYLTDLITAYFAAAGMMSALLRRAVEGGSYHVKVSLARSAMWVQELGVIDHEALGHAPEQDNYPYKLIVEDTPYGKLSHLSSAITFSDMPDIKLFPVSPFGAHEPRW
ncbi:Acetyl-CoA:oxalate CoA-transferase [Aquicella siphonis]|uniref:Acetyl-CoA:oxalate CoA-transferase n=1 Tax=Aquicella siphonis TaxID=254247 RepID=A0A5E4PG82_9COXI|nr:CoA transferase [Aquicella siphonis]VVC75457.1 Acetyl-CoA:oxalate CoA-transferase [Aquicella siphonis]